MKPTSPVFTPFTSTIWSPASSPPTCWVGLPGTRSFTNTPRQAPPNQLEAKVRGHLQKALLLAQISDLLPSDYKNKHRDDTNWNMTPDCVMVGGSHRRTRCAHVSNTNTHTHTVQIDFQTFKDTKDSKKCKHTQFAQRPQTHMHTTNVNLTHAEIHTHT